MSRPDSPLSKLNQALDSGLRTYSVYAQLTAVYALAGKMDEAHTALAESRRLNPRLTLKWIVDHTSGIPAVLDGLRRAGLPEE